MREVLSRRFSRFGFGRAALLAGVALLMTSTATRADDRPNIVFIMSDDHAVRAVSAYGHSLVQTPNIDRIAEHGIRFDRAYVGNAICGPSRATTLTGLHSHGNGFYTNEWSGPFDGSQQTFPKLLQKAGYHTGLIGKWHLYSDPTGFDHWEIIQNMMQQGSYYNPVFKNPAGEEQTTGYVADLITDKTIRWLDSVKGDGRPFLLMYNHKSPHRNWMPAPQELEAWEEAATIAEPPTLFRDLSGEVRARRSARMTIADYMTENDLKLSPPRNLNEGQLAMWQRAFGRGNTGFAEADLRDSELLRWKYQRYVKSYVATVTGMDRAIGRLLDYLENNGMMENTLIVYTSDQGFFLGENGWFDKRWMDEVSARIPLLIQWPGRIKPGLTTNALVENIDFAPTLLAAAGVEPERPMHGRDLSPLFEEAVPAWSRDLYYHFYENPGFHGVERHYGIITARYKLVHYYESDEWELFDLVVDPDELHSIYDTEAGQAVVPELKRRLAALRVHYGVPEQDPAAPWYWNIWIRAIEQLMRLM